MRWGLTLSGCTLLHDDFYIQNSHRDTLDEKFLQTFLNNCWTVVDILHGKKNLPLSYGLSTGSY